MAKVLVRFYLDDRRDADLLVWLDRQANRSQSIRRVIRAGLMPIGHALADAHIAATDSLLPENTGGLDVPTLRQVLREELARLTIDHGPGVLDNPLSGAEDEETTEMLESLLDSWDLA